MDDELGSSKVVSIANKQLTKTCVVVTCVFVITLGKDWYKNVYMSYVAVQTNFTLDFNKKKHTTPKTNIIQGRVCLIGSQSFLIYLERFCDSNSFSLEVEFLALSYLETLKWL